jgi:hypothetical protein
LKKRQLSFCFHHKEQKDIRKTSNLEACTFYQAEWAGKVFSYCELDIQHVIEEEEKELTDPEAQEKT